MPRDRRVELLVEIQRGHLRRAELRARFVEPAPNDALARQQRRIPALRIGYSEELPVHAGRAKRLQLRVRLLLGQAERAARDERSVKEEAPGNHAL